MDKNILCSKCGSKYRLTFTRIRERDKDKIYCNVCGELLFEYDEAKIWSANLVERREDHLKGK